MQERYIRLLMSRQPLIICAGGWVTMRPETRLYILWRYQISIMPEKTRIWLSQRWLPRKWGRWNIRRWSFILIRIKGWKVFLLALMLIPVSRPIKLMMAGKHSPYIMRKLRFLIENMGQRQSKKSSLQKKGNSIKVFPPALQNSRSGIIKD